MRRAYRSSVGLNPPQGAFRAGGASSVHPRNEQAETAVRQGHWAARILGPYPSDGGCCGCKFVSRRSVGFIIECPKVWRGQSQCNITPNTRRSELLKTRTPTS